MVYISTFITCELSEEAIHHPEETMAWGARSGVDDLLQRLQQPATGKNLCVLSFRKLSESDVQKLAGAIASNRILEELYLSGHKLGESGTRAFADALAANSTLQHLSIGDDAMGDANVALLCGGLARNAQSAISVWDLEHKSIGVAGATAIGELLATNSILKNLNLARNALSDDGVKRLAVDGLSRNERSALETISLMETGVSGAALDHMAQLLEQPHCALQTLQLSFNDLSSAGTAFFVALAKNKSVKSLYLKETKLGDAHALALADALKTNTALVDVDLSDNALTSLAAVALAEALKSNSTLQRLTLGGNKCGDIGAQAIGDALRDANTTLGFVDLANNELTHVGVGSLLTAKALKSLRVFNNKLADGLTHVLPVLTTNTAIETLDLGANALHGELSIQLFDQLHSHSSLVTLEMGGNSLGQEGHEALDRLRHANTKLDVAVDKNAQNEDGSFDFEQQ